MQINYYCLIIILLFCEKSAAYSLYPLQQTGKETDFLHTPLYQSINKKYILYDSLQQPLQLPFLTKSQQQHQMPDTTRKNNLQEKTETIELKEIVVRGDRTKNIQMKSAQNIILVDKSYIEENFSGSLMHSLEKLPGIRAMSIGSGQSKPTVRGLGFNRMIVTENGIKHEGQQWGEDHGLEIDQFSVDEVEVVKGPGSIMYGGDAIGGVIQLRNNHIPSKKTEGNIKIYGRSNNQSLGTSAHVAGRSDRWYYKINATYIDYADYKVPTDSIQYYSYYIRLKDRRLRNTAGREKNAGITMGFLGSKFRSNLLISNINSHSGFFADAHGLEVRLSDIDYDRSTRDIDLPKHAVNHFKLVNNSTWQFGKASLDVNIAFQNNFREEFSEPVSHGYMPIPPDSLERRFNKNTYTATTLFKIPIQSRFSLQAGLSVEHQNNRRGGWGFVLPDFRTTSMGALIYGRYHLSNALIISTGVRTDKVNIEIDNYTDWYETPNEEGNPVFKVRATDLRRNFSNVSWSVGLNWQEGEWLLKTNIGKSFRAAIPKELGSDGINYHIFRYEKGDSDLKAEESYQIDMGFGWHNDKISIQWEPFINFFPNYIYLNPTPVYYEGLQMYHFSQAKVIRYGFETDLQFKLTRQFTVGMQSEYLYAKQLSGEKKGYSLPFSPPWSTNVSIGYRPGEGFLRNNFLLGAAGDILVEYKITGSQNRIVPPEEKTDGYQLLNLSFGRSWQIKDKALKLRLQAENLLNKRYYDHTGYYRLIDVPEPGRNISVLFGFTF